MTEDPSAKETVERAFAALSRRDLDGVLEHLDPEVELVPMLTGPDDRVYNGHDGARRWLGEIWQTWEGYRASLRWIRELDEHTAVVEWIGTLRRHGSDVELETRAFGLMERGTDTGGIRSWRFYATEAEALAAAQMRLAGERAS